MIKKLSLETLRQMYNFLTIKTVVVRPKPNTSGCSSRQIVFAVAITAGYSSYTAYHRAVPHSAYDLSFLINQPGAENCRTTGNESRGGGGGRRRSGRRRRRRGGRSRGSSTAHWQHKLRRYGYYLHCIS